MKASALCLLICVVTIIAISKPKQIKQDTVTKLIIPDGNGPNAKYVIIWFPSKESGVDYWFGDPGQVYTLIAIGGGLILPLYSEALCGGPIDLFPPPTRTKTKGN